ncbi:integrase catalytic domain-containing protein [Trichonephila clavipes]|nr:integrase catalytic domain-containing protein [Trichonephila clavipes]
MQFWPINGKGIARKTVHDCIVCFRQKPTGVDQLMGNLPSERVTPSAAFLNSGWIFCGPFQIKFKKSEKGDIFKSLCCDFFVCLATKAIHLEAVTDLTTEAFIAALKRLCARRGRISTLMSDNETNFKGAAAELNRFIKLICNKNETLANYFASEAIQWKFIPPRSPNFGGFVGGRVPLSDNINEYEVLTPGHFIIGRPISAIPEPTILDISDNRLSRWQYTTKCVQTIWKRWKNDYLNHLQQRNKWQFEKNNVAVGCLVLLKENDLPPCKWAMARILEFIYGTDGGSAGNRECIKGVGEKRKTMQYFTKCKNRKIYPTLTLGPSMEAFRNGYWRMTNFVLFSYDTFDKIYHPFQKDTSLNQQCSKCGVLLDIDERGEDRLLTFIVLDKHTIIE